MDPNNPSDPPAGGDTQPPADAGESLFAAAVTPGEHDWLPEKFRVSGEDGKLDEAASARKLAHSYVELEKHKGAPPNVPGTWEEYTLTVPEIDGKPMEGVDVEAFKADPVFQAFAKDMHALKLSNEQMNAVVGRYLQLAPQLLAADKVQSLAEAKAELGKIWPDEPTMQRNLQGVAKVVEAYGSEAADEPGSRERLMKRFATDPDFAAFAAKVAGEIGEDKGVRDVGAPAEADVEALVKSKAYWDASHPDHTATKAKVTAFYEGKHGGKPR